jgi:hypothetical protein
VVVSNPEAGENLFHRTQFHADFEAIVPYLTRLSIARREPNVFVSVVLVPEAMAPIENFVVSLAKSLQPGRKKS